MKSYEYRPGQLQMALAVEEACRDRAISWSNAGTGTGKTMAYLFPAIARRERIRNINRHKKIFRTVLFQRCSVFGRVAGSVPLRVCYLKGVPLSLPPKVYDWKRSRCCTASDEVGAIRRDFRAWERITVTAIARDVGEAWPKIVTALSLILECPPPRPAPAKKVSQLSTAVF
jgi:hypothetical protein